ncbi:MAG: hypothetical protein ACK55B_06655 [Cyanobacteriota bacterium]
MIAWQGKMGFASVDHGMVALAFGESPSSREDPLALAAEWPCPIPLTPLEQALQQCVFRSGLTRQAWLQRLARSIDKPGLIPLLWLLPRGWRLAPAQLPPHLQTLAGVLERGLLTPTLLAALADDLPHLLPQAAPNTPTALRLWAPSDDPDPVPTLAALLGLPVPIAPLQGVGGAAAPRAAMHRTAAPPSPFVQLTGGLIWGNQGLNQEQSQQERERNSRCARVLNRLGANLLGGDPLDLEGCRSSAGLVGELERQGWQVWAQLRCGITSFGLGASLPLEDGEGWSQVPLALPIRTGLLDPQGTERLSLLPHCCLEMDWRRGEDTIRVQFYQGTEGLCGWEGLNDLHRPWQNDRHNGTLRYFGERYTGKRLADVLDLCDGMALVHNLEASERHLLHGGYGPLGLCIDSAALLQQALEGRCQVFPVLLGGIWRERLLKRSQRVLATAPLGEGQRRTLEGYQRALGALPYDGFLQGAGAAQALERLRACQPSSSPFVLVGALAQPKPSCRG